MRPTTPRLRTFRPLLVLVVAWVLLAMLAPAVADQSLASGAGDLPGPRLAGGDRVATGEAVVASWVAAGGRSDVVVVVPQHQTAVALASAGLAGHHGGITMLSTSPPRPSTVAAVEATGATQVIVAGGDAALLEGWRATGLATTEVTADGGPPAVAAAIARVLLATGGGDGNAAADGARSVEQRAAGQVANPTDHAFLAGTGGLPDALAVGPLAYASATPLLLTAALQLDPHTAFLVSQTGLSRITVLGGTAVVSDGVVAQLTAMGVDVQRIAGADRQQTALALAVAQVAGHDPAVDPAAQLAGRLAEGVLLAAGDDPADAASAAAFAVRSGQVLLPPGTQVTEALAAHCGQVGPMTVLGGPAAVTAAEADFHRRAAQHCDGRREPMTVRVAVATPGAPDTGAAVVAAVTGPDGWASRRVRLIGVGEGARLGIVIADPGACGAAVVCRRGNTLVIDGGHWAGALPARRQRILDHAVGSWLGEPVTTSCGGQVMDPLDCPDAVLDDAARDRVADRFVPTARLSFAGDVHGERHIASAVAAGVNPLGPVIDHLVGADLAVLNLETPLSHRGSPADKTFVFRGPPALASDLAEAGVDIVSLANNHALDYGVDALADTLVHSDEAGLATVGAGMDAARAYAPVVVDTTAGIVAVIGLTRVLHTRTWEATATRPGLASAYDEAAALAAVAQAREVADHVVVAIHWGTERADCPDASQRRLATLLSDAGVDIIVGHHPHILQGVQVRGDTLIAYSMGNFVWYHNSAPSRFTGILDVELPLLDQPRWTFQPAEIGTDGSPHLAGGSLAATISARLTDRSPGGPVGCGFP